MTDDSATRVLLSMIVPCFNEGAGIMRAHKQLMEALGNVPGIDLEIVYVDDGSRDDTFATLKTIAAASSQVRVLQLSRNFGKDRAVAAGISRAAGDVVVIMDADLQEPPDVVLEMLKRWRAGADVVYGVRISRKDDSVVVRWTAAAYQRFHDLVSRGRSLDERCDFHLLTRPVVDILKSMPERCRFHRSLIAWLGFRQEPVRFVRPPRAFGKPKIDFWARTAAARASLLPVSAAPLRLALAAGIVTAGAAVVLAAGTLGVRLYSGLWPPLWVLLCSPALLLSGIHLLVVGILGEYVGATFNETLGRPLFVVKEAIGFGGEDCFAGDGRIAGEDAVRDDTVVARERLDGAAVAP